MVLTLLGYMSQEVSSQKVVCEKGLESSKYAISGEVGRGGGERGGDGKRERGRGRRGERERETERDRQRQTDRQKETDRQREREREETGYVSNNNFVPFSYN